jgi:hypothetical protein
VLTTKECLGHPIDSAQLAILDRLDFLLKNDSIPGGGALGTTRFSSSLKSLSILVPFLTARKPPWEKPVFQCVILRARIDEV